MSCPTRLIDSLPSATSKSKHHPVHPCRFFRSGWPHLLFYLSEAVGQLRGSSFKASTSRATWGLYNAAVAHLSGLAPPPHSFPAFASPGHLLEALAGASSVGPRNSQSDQQEQLRECGWRSCRIRATEEELVSASVADISSIDEDEGIETEACGAACLLALHWALHFLSEERWAAVEGRGEQYNSCSWKDVLPPSALLVALEV